MFRKTSILIISIILLFSAGAGWLTFKLDFDYNFEHFFPSGDEELDFFLDFREKFENDNDYILFAFENEEGVFKKDFLLKVQAFTDSLEKLPHVEAVHSPTQLSKLVLGPMGGMIKVPYLHIEDTSRYEKDSIDIYRSENMVGTFFSSSGNSLCLVLKNKQVINKKESDELLSGIERLFKKFDFDEYHYAGKIRAQKIYLSKMKEELLVFMSSAMILIIIFLSIAFRSTWGVIVPLFIVLLAILWTLAVIELSDHSLNLMTSLLPTILFVVGMSDAVHIISRYLEELRSGLPKLEAIKVTFREIGAATFLTSFTTAIGFLTLLLTSIKPIREFGLFTSIGVFIAFVIAILLLPSVLYLMKKPKLAKRSYGRVFWIKKLRVIFTFMINNQKKIVWAYIVVILLSIWGISRINVDYYLLEDLDENNPLQQDLKYFEREYSGVRPFEMVVTVKDSDKTVYDKEVLRELNKVENYLVEEYGVGFILSPLTIVKTLNQALHGGNPEYYRFPGTKKELNKVLSYARRMKGSKQFENLIADEGKTGRISAKLPDIGSKRAKELNKELEHFINEKVNTGLLSFHRTGTALLIDKNNEKLASNMLGGLALAFFVIALLVGVLFRSLRIAFISLVPNIVPLVVIGGVMGALGINLNMSTSIVFTIAFGIAVDDTIHFLSKLRLEMGKGKTLLYSLKRTYFSTGRAIVVTTIILCGGFLPLMFSDFQSTFMIGFFVSLILFVAVITDLLLLPILLFAYRKNGLRKMKNRP